MYQQLKKLKYSIDLVKVKNIHEKTKDNKLKIIDIKLNFKDPFKVPKKIARFKFCIIIFKPST